MALDLRRWLPDDVLAKADRAGMLASLEVRTPYLQRELAELAALVPPHLHLAGGGKALLRRLLAEVLPGGPPRPKTAFRVPAAQWLRGPLAGIVDAQLAAGTAYADGWLSREATERLWREHRTGRRDWTALLWPALAFGLWLDRAVP
jgi:asparagine synthase (glutamine-hydrolysing)